MKQLVKQPQKKPSWWEAEYSHEVIMSQALPFEDESKEALSLSCGVVSRISL